MNQVSTGTASSSATARPAGAGDMFLLVKGATHGQINGEALDDKHKGEIEVLGWSWGIQGKPSLGGGGASGKATIRELKIIKRVDKASTALMGAVRTNEVIKEAVLTLRKTGKGALEFLKISIEQGRVVSLDIEAGDASGGSTLIETVTLSFNKVSVEYTPQGGDGQAQGGTTFQDQWGDN
jgi:type VI secretion system secreted protein Hcp